LPVGAAIEHLQGSRYVATKQDVDCLQLDRVNGSAPLLGAAARLAQAIEQEGDDDDGEPGLEAFGDIHGIECAQHRHAEAWCPDCRFFKMRRGARKQARYLPDDF